MTEVHSVSDCIPSGTFDVSHIYVVLLSCCLLGYQRSRGKRKLDTDKARMNVSDSHVISDKIDCSFGKMESRKRKRS